MKRPKKSELLIGVMIGLYGNWFIAALERIVELNSLSQGLFVLSFFPFVAYFAQVFTELEEQHWIKWMPSKSILGIIHISLVYLSLWSSDLLLSKYTFSWAGLAFWMMLMHVFQQTLA